MTGNRSDPGVHRYSVYTDREYVVEGVACLFYWLRLGTTKWVERTGGDVRVVFQIPRENR